ncbi:MAG: hypothetical protein H6608_10505 [Flavobacteriales bacterium]|nr:hypothetical protein [Bacteroidota bacterium]MCB9241556.1 hypothetical protein [Flavobacteriales bacterium]
MTATSQLSNLENSIKRLVDEVNRLRSENQSLKSELSNIKSEFDVQKNRAEVLAESQNLVKLAGTISDESTDNSDLKERIEGYLEEIDKCIALLSS